MLTHLSLVNFRNHPKFELDLGQITVLVGDNGVGKTNVLEAVSLLSCGRSFRGDNRLEMIKFDADFARIVGDDLEIFVSRHPRLVFQAKERGVKQKIADFVGLMPSVLFSPESLKIITGEPKERRRFLDIVISQKNHKYYAAISSYKKVLLQRNNLLKMIADGSATPDQLDFWDEELVKSAIEITKYRKEAVKDFSEKISDFYRTISGQKKSNIEIIYHAKADGDFAAKLLAKRSIDIAVGLSTSGPHRDDLQFKLSGLEAEKYASRGELRSIILSLKMAELKYLGNGVAPILLLDDIFSEFDADHRAHLAELIANYQTLITTTDREHLSSKLLSSAKIIEIT
ncbi:MAG: DNA replication/repair protein RecF [Candidatus Berkelbacteria bacterium]|nr:DNA replication/repair protein RecF [Candidatus Berkelbacteria bacterium]